MPPPFDMQARAQWLNWRVLNRCNDPDDKLWQKQTSFYAKAERLRKWAHDEWDDYDAAHRYQDLDDKRKDDLAASMAGLIIQACGRLLRGGVPFRALFIDAAWAPNTATGTGPDTAETSLLLRMSRLLNAYAQAPIGQALYAPLARSLSRVEGVVTAQAVAGPAISEMEQNP
jgi:hypothetical protein